MFGLSRFGHTRKCLEASIHREIKCFDREFEANYRVKGAQLEVFSATKIDEIVNWNGNNVAVQTDGSFA